MPVPPEQAALTAAYVARQRLLAAELSRDLVLLIRNVFLTADPAGPAGAWPATKIALGTLARDRCRRSATLAGGYYRDLRRLAVPPPPNGFRRDPLAGFGRPQPTRRVDPATGALLAGPDRTRPDGTGGARTEPARPGRDRTAPGTAAARAEPDPVLHDLERDAGDLPQEVADAIAAAERDDLDDDRADATFNATGIATYQRGIRAGQDPEQAADTMVLNLSGSVSALALEGGRTVLKAAVIADEEAIGWARVTDANPCAFCAMLASRGAVYRSAQTAGGAANKKFTGDGLFKFHNHDGCSAVPVFDPDDPVLDAADALYDQWQKATAGTSGPAMLQAWTAYWATQRAGADAGG